MAQPSDKEILTRHGYKLLSKIGKGSFSTVYKASNDEAGKIGEYAIKIIKAKDSSLQEALVLKTLKHENIVKYVEHFNTTSHLYLVTEYCDEGDLENYIHSKHKLAESLVKIIMQQLASAMRYLQNDNICHMDIKPKNILIKSKPRLTFKLSDFGIAEVITAENMEKWRDNGTIAYMAPEKLTGKTYDIRSDLWSLGIVIFQCLFGRPSYFHASISTVKSLMTKETLLKIPVNSHISSCCEDLLTKLLQYNPARRIPFEDLYKHPFLDLDNIPTTENYQNIIKMVNEAVSLEKQHKYEDAIVLYTEAINGLQPYLEIETDPAKKEKLLSKCSEYTQRINELNKSLSTNKEASEKLPDCSLEMLMRMSTSTPGLVTGIDIAKCAEEYLADKNYQLAFTKLSEALDVLIPLCSKEPSGYRKKLLLAQVDKWLKLGEELKKVTRQTE